MRLKKYLQEKYDPIIATAFKNAKGMFTGTSEPSRELVQAVIYHPKEKDWMKAVELVTKEKNLDRKTAKKLKKFFKTYGGKK